MLRSFRHNTRVFTQKTTGVHTAEFCLFDKMYGRNIEGTSLSVELDPDRISKLSLADDRICRIRGIYRIIGLLL